MFASFPQSRQVLWESRLVPPATDSVRVIGKAGKDEPEDHTSAWPEDHGAAAVADRCGSPRPGDGGLSANAARTHTLHGDGNRNAFPQREPHRGLPRSGSYFGIPVSGRPSYLGGAGTRVCDQP